MSDYHFYINDPSQFDLERIERENSHHPVIMLRHPAHYQVVMVGIQVAWLKKFTGSGLYMSGQRMSEQWGYAELQYSTGGFRYYSNNKDTVRRWRPDSEASVRAEVEVAREWLSSRRKIEVVPL